MGRWLVLYAGRNTDGQWIVWSQHPTEERARENATHSREHGMGGRWLVCQITWEWPEHNQQHAQGGGKGVEG